MVSWCSTKESILSNLCTFSLYLIDEVDDDTTTTTTITTPEKEPNSKIRSLNSIGADADDEGQLEEGSFGDETAAKKKKKKKKKKTGNIEDQENGTGNLYNSINLSEKSIMLLLFVYVYVIIYLIVCLFVCLFVCLLVCLFTCLRLQIRMKTHQNEDSDCFTQLTQNSTTTKSPKFPSLL